MNFKGGKLKSARIMAGMSLQDLADRVPGSVSKQAIHKYELGEMIPNEITIGYLAGILEVPETFFFRETNIKLGSIEFRNTHSNHMSAKEHGMVQELTLDFISRYIELEQLLGIKEGFKNPLWDFPISSLSDIENAVSLIRESWKLGAGPLPSIIELLEDHGIKILEVELSDGFDGLQTYESESATPILVINKSHFKSADRKRFTVLHELGHLLLKLDHYTSKEREKFCNAFAGAMLLPKAAIDIEFGVKRTNLSFPELGAVKQQYGISIQAIAYRLRETGIITENYFKQFMFMINQLNYKVIEPFPYQIEEKTCRFDQLIFRAVSEKIISTNKAAELKNVTESTFRKLYLGV